MLDPTAIGPAAAVHLLNRAGFGPRPGQVREVLAQGIESYLEQQLKPVPSRALAQRLAPYPDLDSPISTVLAIYRGTETVSGKSITQVLEDFYTAKIVRAVESPNQLEEVLVDFWFNHFSVNLQNMFVRQSITSYERDAIRPHVLGRFGDLLQATAAHPAMLFNLDNHLSKKNSVVGGKLVRGLNENYGRELLELHTVGVTAGYTQDDVVAAARCFSGWTIDDLKTKGGFLFRAADHDPDAKSVFGLEVRAGGGIQDGQKLLDYLAVHPKTAEFVSRKLARRFVADDPPASLVDRCSKTFLASRGDIPAVLREIFTSTEFWASSARRKLKTPLELVVSALRAVGAHVESASPGITKALSNMGMQPYFCTPPTGYADRGAEWVSPLYLHRINFALALAAGKVQGVVVTLEDVVRSAGGNPAAAASISAVFNEHIFGGGLSAQTLAALKVSASESVGLLSKVAGLALASPEMQVK